MIGRTLGHYRITEQIGMGGMATVYKAYDPDTDRYVAIKVLPEHFSGDPKFRQRFEREAKAIAKLEHIHILPLFAYGEDDGVAYMVMRYLKAGSLTERIQAGALSLTEASRLLNQIASALDYAHANGVLHRDVKPSNILLDTDGNAFLTDFGIAKMVESSLDLTGGGILGTPAYMSPEQCRGIELTPASDQYALGIILYEMVTGRTPFQAETPIALIHMQLSDPLPIPRQLRPDLPEQAEQVILKALTKDPTLRYPTCGAMAAAFARVVAEFVEKTQTIEEDRTIASPAPSAVTAPAVADEATMLHSTPAPAAPSLARRRWPRWVWGVAAALMVVCLIGTFLIMRRAALNKADLNKAEATPAVGVITPTGPIEVSEPTNEAASEVTVETAPVAETPPTETPAPDIVPGEEAKNREIMPCEWRGLDAGLCIYDPEREQPIGKILTEAKLEFVGSVSWSPDGQQIVFGAVEPNADSDFDTTLYVVNADGSNLTRLPQLGNDLDPAWSPDGEWLVFHSSCRLGIMRPDGTERRVIWPVKDNQCISQPQWSPDSRSVVFSVTDNGGGNITFPLTRQVLVMSASTSDKPVVVATTTHPNEECLATEAAFSPNGGQVAYTDERCRAWLVSSDGSGQPKPIDNEFPYGWLAMTFPRWSGQSPELPTPERVYYDAFFGSMLNPTYWHSSPSILVKDGRVLFASKAADRAGAWDGTLEAVLPVPVKSIETMIGMEWARGDHVGFGVDFWDDETQQAKSVWLSADGSVLLDEGQGEFRKIMPPKSKPPLEYYLMVEWLDTGEAAVWIGDQEIARFPVHDFAHRVVFWGHLEAGDEMSGYLDEVRLTFADPNETFVAAPAPPAAAEKQPTPAPSNGPPG